MSLSFSMLILAFKDHLSTVLKQVYAKVGALRRLKKLVPRYLTYAVQSLYIGALSRLQPTSFRDILTKL